MRIEDIDAARCRADYRDALIEDLRWFGFEWDEGPYLQSERRSFYFAHWDRLRAAGLIYPCTCSRRDVLGAAAAPHDENEEPVYPGTCRPAIGSINGAATPAGANWRFRVPEGELVSFRDERLGDQSAVAGREFGDFIVWRRDDVPAYQLAVVTDDALMEISEVVRGADLITSTFRQLVLYRALELSPPRFYHAPLITDAAGQRLAKRHAALSLRELRAQGLMPQNLRDQITARAAAL